MKETFLKNLKSIFNKQARPAKQQQQITPRKVTFGNDNKQSKKVSMGKNQDDIKIDGVEDITDTRYENLQKLPQLKQLGLKKDQIYDGEIPILFENKFIYCKLAQEKYQQVLFIATNYKICVKPNKEDFTFFPLGKIQKLHKYVNNQNAYKLLIALKDGRKFKFRISSQGIWKKVYDKIEMFAFIRIKKHFFAFRQYQNNPELQEKYKGWQMYDPKSQYQRMGIQLMVHSEQTVTQFTSDYKLLDNRDGKICTTYPAFLVVPSRMPYDYLLRCSKFRSRCRLPALSYVYEYQKGKFASVYRSSQSKVGFQNSRCAEDQIMLRAIGDPNFNYKDENPYVGSPNCKIYDARGYMAALGNKFSGKGYELPQFYRNCQLEFLNIPNIHAVRQSYNKMLKASFGEDLKFHVTMAQSQWYDYVFLILSGAIILSKSLLKGENNLVHCSDGWDRTAQLCSLAQLILDPYYRTIKGFQMLIEKDWIHFGHQFAIRLAQGMNNPTGEQKSQVFLQYLDCVSQILYQYPSEFEFNYKFLEQIGQQAYGHLFGNFLCDCQLQMQKYNVSKKTISLWSYLEQNREIYLNPFYIPSLKTLQISSAQKHMRFWKQHFLKYVDGFKDVYDIYSCKFTQENLQIMHKQLKKQKQLLYERYADNENLLEELNTQIIKRSSSNKQQSNPENGIILQQIIDKTQKESNIAISLDRNLKQQENQYEVIKINDQQNEIKEKINQQMKRQQIQ